MRFDFLFSYWVLFWYILYYFKFVKSYNPKFALILALIENLLILFFMFFYKPKIYTIIYFIIVVFFMKIIPLYIVWNTCIKMKDIYMTIFLFCIYLIWIYINNITLKKIFNETYDVIRGKKLFPSMTLLYNTIKIVNKSSRNLIHPR